MMGAKAGPALPTSTNAAPSKSPASTAPTVEEAVKPTRVMTIEAFADAETVEEVVRALMHTIFFQRQQATVQPAEVEVLDGAVSVPRLPDAGKVGVGGNNDHKAVGDEAAGAISLASAAITSTAAGKGQLDGLVARIDRHAELVRRDLVDTPRRRLRVVVWFGDFRLSNSSSYLGSYLTSNFPSHMSFMPQQSATSKQPSSTGSIASAVGGGGGAAAWLTTKALNSLWEATISPLTAGGGWVSSAVGKVPSATSPSGESGAGMPGFATSATRRSQPALSTKNMPAAITARLTPSTLATATEVWYINVTLAEEPQTEVQRTKLRHAIVYTLRENMQKIARTAAKFTLSASSSSSSNTSSSLPPFTTSATIPATSATGRDGVNWKTPSLIAQGLTSSPQPQPAPHHSPNIPAPAPSRPSSSPSCPSWQDWPSWSSGSAWSSADDSEVGEPCGFHTIGTGAVAAGGGMNNNLKGPTGVCGGGGLGLGATAEVVARRAETMARLRWW